MGFSSGAMNTTAVSSPAAKAVIETRQAVTDHCVKTRDGGNREGKKLQAAFERAERDWVREARPHLVAQGKRPAHPDAAAVEAHRLECVAKIGTIWDLETGKLRAA